MDIAESPQTEINNDTKYPNIRFEAAIHKGSFLTDGLVDSHLGWNREVFNRVSEYKPELVTVDGDSPTGKLDPISLALSLPDFDNDLSKKTDNDLHVVRGDIEEISSGLQIIVQSKNIID